MRVCSVSIRRLTDVDKDVISRVVDIHIETFKGFFLTFMGKKFLRQMYKAYVKNTSSGLFIAEADCDVVGFLAYSEDISGLYKYMIKHQLIPFALYSLWAFARKPRVFMRLVRAFLKPGETRREERYIELSSIGVHPEAKKNGIGSELINNLKNIVDFRTFEYIKLETDAKNNDAVNKFYLKNGFSLYSTYFTREGREMNEYRFSKERL